MKQELEDYIRNSNNQSEFENIHFQITKDASFSGMTFRSCKFDFTESSDLRLNKCDFYGCKFNGIEANEEFLEKKGFLQLFQCEHIYNSEIKGKYNRIQIHLCKLKNFIGAIYSENFQLSSSEVIDFFIKGKSKEINLNGTYLTSEKRKDSIWSMQIDKSAQCVKTIFHNVEVNPFYLATKCDDKSSLDLTSAKLVDDWSRLRKNYSGISLFIVFFLSFLFFLPLITHSYFLLLTTKVTPLMNTLEQVPLWESILYGGKHGWAAFGYSVLTVILITYNALRIYMTISIAKLREEERFLGDSNFQLVSIHPEKFKVQLWVDRYLKYFFYVSALYACFKIWDTLHIMVPALP